MKVSNHFRVPARFTPPFSNVHRLALNRNRIIILISLGIADKFHSPSWFNKPQDIKRFKTFVTWTCPFTGFFEESLACDTTVTLYLMYITGSVKECCAYLEQRIDLEAPILI